VAGALAAQASANKRTPVPPALTPSARTLTWRVLVPLIVVGLLVVAFSVPWKLNFLRGYIGERVKEATGRELVIEGDLWWRWGWQSRVQAQRVRFSNPPWAGRPEPKPRRRFIRFRII